MYSMISTILGSCSQIYFMIAGVVIGVYSFLINRNAKLKSENEALNDGIEEIKYESEKIITIQKKQVEIVSSPPASRDDIHEQLLDLSRRSKRNDKQNVD
jgi:hypothetical protein